MRGSNDSHALTDLQVTRLVLLLQATPVEDLGRYVVKVDGAVVGSFADAAGAVRFADVHRGVITDRTTGDTFSRRQVTALGIAGDALRLARQLREAA